MITVANLTHTAARVQYAFEHKRIRIEELCDPEKILHIDSKVLDEAEAQEEPAEVLVEAAAVDEADEEAGEESAEENGTGAEKEAHEEGPRRVAAQDGGHDWTRRPAR